MDSMTSLRYLSPCEAVVRRVANAEGVDPLELPPLYGSVDPDALNSLVDPMPGSGSVRRCDFVYNGYEVSITGDGVVHLREPSESARRKRQAPASTRP
jgi:hypothetical protein